MEQTQVTYSAGAVARTLGVSPATLRTWARRYGVEPSSRSEGSHRRYSAGDLQMLRDMQRLIRSGVSVARAATLAREGVSLEAVEPDRKGSPEAGTRRLWEAAKALDSAGCILIVTEAIETYGVIPAWDDLIRPVLDRAGREWDSGTAGVEVEHVLSDAVGASLAVDRPLPASGVILAAAPGEDHVLPLLALRRALAERGVGALALSARTPVQALADAVGRAHPAVVIVFAQRANSADTAMFTALPSIRPRPVVGAAGPGWSELPPGVTHLNGLGTAVDFVTGSLSALP